MHEFHYKKDKLYCENASLADIAGAVGTPCYVYSRKSFLDHYRKLKNALTTLRPLICFAVKANSNLSVLKLMHSAGAGMDIVSGGELYRALKAGVNPRKIVFAGVGKTPDEIVYAIKSGILFFNVESLAELMMIDGISQAFKKRTKVAIRINPDIPIQTHQYIATGGGDSKFGVDFLTAHDIFKNQKSFRGVDICGIHIHVGSQLLGGDPFVNGIKKVLSFIKEHKIKIKYLNIGGGLGIVYDKEKPQTATQYAAKIIPLLKGKNFKILMEPGRFISGNSGALITRIIYRKKTLRRNFSIVDAGMNDLLRPSIYNAFHTVLPVASDREGLETCDIVGPICESGDFLGKDRQIEKMYSGDLMAFLGTGAYGFTMSSNYNSRPRVCEVMVSGKSFKVIRKRETYQDLIRGE